jgi:hypothetical protein
VEDARPLEQRRSVQFDCGKFFKPSADQDEKMRVNERFSFLEPFFK